MEKYENSQNIKKGLMVDIDETLSWTVGFLVEQMQKKFGNPENLSVKEMIEKYRYTQNVPYWQSVEALQWVKEKLHSNELQEELPLIKDANIYLNKIDEVIPVSAYITIRPEVILSGTQKWLDKHNFPKVRIICRPANIDHKDGNKWKAEILEKSYPNIVGIIDDNVKLSEFLSKDYKGVIFLYDHSIIKSDLNVIPCRNWEKVYEEVKKYSNK